MKTEQWFHQKTEYDKYRDCPARFLGWQMRTGKTKAIIDNACWLAKECKITGVLVIAPNGVHNNWAIRELPRHNWDNVSYCAFVWKNSNTFNDMEFDLFNNIAMNEQHIKWLCVNMESLIIERVQQAIKRFIRKSDVMVVYDESHHFAVPGAKRTSVARGLARLCKYRRNLTGTMVENSPLQAFSQYELLEKGALGHDTYGSFKEDFAVYGQGYGPGGRRFPKLVGYKNVDELKRRMAPYTSVVLRSDCEDLPPVQVDQVYVELDDRIKAQWKLCKANDLAFLEGMFLQAALTGGAALSKLQQIEGGYWKDGASYRELVPPDSNAKMLVLLEEITLHNGQVIVWCQYLHEIDAISKVLANMHIKSGMVHGGVKDRPQVLESFRAGQFKILVAQPKAGGEGLDMSTASKIIWYSQTPDSIVRAQANERATAVGKEGVQIVDLVSPGGVDDYFLKLTIRKTTLAEDISRKGMREVLEALSVC